MHQFIATKLHEYTTKAPEFGKKKFGNLFCNFFGNFYHTKDTRYIDSDVNLGSPPTLFDKFFGMAAMPFPCNGILLIQGV